VPPSSVTTPQPAEPTAAPVTRPGPSQVIPQPGSFGDSREVEAARRLGIGNPQVTGIALDAIRAIDQGMNALEAWTAHVRRYLEVVKRETQA